jgi:hypothetical protein
MSAATSPPVVLAGLALALGLGQAVAATPAAGAASGAQPASHPDKSAQSLHADRMRKCKVMTGDEKAACERDARTVATEKAQRDAQANGAGASAGKAAQSGR